MGSTCSQHTEERKRKRADSSAVTKSARLESSIKRASIRMEASGRTSFHQSLRKRRSSSSSSFSRSVAAKSTSSTSSAADAGVLDDGDKTRVVTAAASPTAAAASAPVIMTAHTQQFTSLSSGVHNPLSQTSGVVVHRDEWSPSQSTVEDDRRASSAVSMSRQSSVLSSDTGIRKNAAPVVVQRPAERVFDPFSLE